MNEKQKLAVDSRMLDLCQTLQHTVDTFLQYLTTRKIINNSERQDIEKGGLDEGKIFKTLQVLTVKTTGWNALIQYLQEHHYSQEAHNLVALASEVTVVEDTTKSQKDLVGDFIQHLVDFYTSDFRLVDGLTDNQEEIENSWVDLPLSTENQMTSDYNDVFRKMKETKSRVALIRGQPGSGKTTLMTKIAYDWAQNTINDATGFAYGLVLAIPLRDSKVLDSDILVTAVQFLLGTNGRSGDVLKAKQISNALQTSDMQILVILDGLDECQWLSSSPLSWMFGSYLDVNRRTSGRVRFNYDLLITSRPYACEVVNKHLSMVKYDIGEFSTSQQDEFVRRRCHTSEGQDRATKYLAGSNVLSEVGLTPLLLLFICFLSDRKDKGAEIPSKLTDLYDTFLCQICNIAANKRSLPHLDSRSWRNCNLIKSLGRLALLGVVRGKLEFDDKEMEICGVVKEESFDSGLLRFKSDVINLRHKADFSHRSIQEFLAALHTIDVWHDTDGRLAEATGFSKINWPIDGVTEMTVEMLAAKMMCYKSRDSQLLRFYFGLLSGKRDFASRMEKFLKEYFSVWLLTTGWLRFFCNCLYDCSDVESRCNTAGVLLKEVVSLNCDRIKRGPIEAEKQKEKILDWTENAAENKHPLPPKPFRPALLAGLKLKWFSEDWTYNVGSKVSNEILLISAWPGFTNLLELENEVKSVTEVRWLWLDCPNVDVDKWNCAMDMIKVVPVRNCWISTGSLEDKTVLKITVTKLNDSPDKDPSAIILGFMALNLGQFGMGKLFNHIVNVDLSQFPCDSLKIFSEKKSDGAKIWIESSLSRLELVTGLLCL